MVELANKQQLLGQYNAIRDAMRPVINRRVPPSPGGAGREKTVDSLTRVATAHAFREKMKSMKDELTGLYSARYFQERLRQELNQAARIRKPLGLALGDLRQLKQYNDTYGHLGGDRVLRGVGRSIREGEHIRISDIPCRTGGDEVAIIYTVIAPEKSTNSHSPKEDLATAALRTLQEVHNRPVTLREGTDITPHLDIGVTVSTPDDTPEAIRHRADLSSYLAKKIVLSGENKIVVASQVQGETLFEVASMDSHNKVVFEPIPDAMSFLSGNGMRI